MAEWTVGVDIGGTKIEAIVVDGAGRLQGTWREPTVADSPDSLLEAINTTVQRALTRAAVTPDHIAALGAGVPGQVDPTTGDVRLAVNLDLHNHPLGPRLQEQLGWPVFVENDIRLAALGTYSRLDPPRPRHFAYLGLGTGVAAGLVINGRLHRGANGLAGEVGHMIVRPDGPLCNCGNRGCLETFVSGPAILRRAREIWSAANGVPADVAAVFAAAEQGHHTARRVVAEMARFLARAIYTLLLAYDVERLVIGGGVSRAGSALLRPLLAEFDRFGAQSPLTALLLTRDKIQLLPADFNAGAWGAVWLARDPDAHQEVPMR